MEIIKPILYKTGHAAAGFAIAGIMFREYTNNMREVPAFIPPTYFYIALGLTTLYCFSYLLTPNK